MLEKIMDLQILLYSMAALGTLGAIGMLTTNLTYRRMLKSTGSKNTGTKNTQGAGSSQRISLKEKWLRLWKTRDRLLHRMNRLVWYPALLSTVILGCAIYFSKTLRIEEIPDAKKADPVLQEEIVDKITSSIKQTAASGSHFSKMLTPEEEKIMREIIREFMA